MPGAVFILSSWYTKFEMARKITIYIMVAMIGNAFGGIVRYSRSQPHIYKLEV